MTKAGCLLGAIIFAGILGCGDDDTIWVDPNMENAVFASADRLVETGVPAFDDTTTTTPEFSWRSTGQKFVYLAVFTSNIEVRNKQIINREDNVWSWHSGLGTGREGNVKFEHGRDMVDGKMLESGPPTPLVPGETYVWAVWAWDDQGIEITYSSQEIRFTVQ